MNSFILRTNAIFAERYMFDLGPCRQSAGWAQVDTWQDAWYFGVWTNPFIWQILTFAEGDLTIELCPTADSYRAAVVRMLRFYDTDRQQAKIDAMLGGATSPMVQAFASLGLCNYLH